MSGFLNRIERHTKQPAFRWVAYLFTLLIFLGSVLPASGLPGSSINDKLQHLFGFFVLTGLWRLSHATLSGLRLFVLLAGYGLFIEFTQYFLPYRTFDLLDWLADCTGVVLALALTRTIR